MVLKSLLLQGFKSFPDKTEIRFLGGVTAIVGPNGSGKSNISDALRWVLGEQSSRSLRGAKMEDVIFSGTQRRVPLGFAEVSLILDNTTGLFTSAHTEIMVTRRYYRSGESEYYLNKQKCRLKDIHELFMDTGLGRDGYSIIGQGRIDEILSLKSEDRRDVFEEAAGITKFRYRKQEAERNLAATEENLVRIRDLYGELENQIQPLEQQAEKAKQYLHFRDELRVLEVSLWMQEFAQMKTTAATAVQNQRICAKQLKTAQDTLEALYRKRDTLRESMHQIDRKNDIFSRELREIEQKAADLQSRCAVLQTNIENDRANNDRMAQQSDEQTAQMQELQQKQQDSADVLTRLDDAWQRKRQAQQNVRESMEKIRQNEREIAQKQADLQQKMQDLQRENFDLELEQTAAKANLEGAHSRRGTLVEEVARCKQQYDAEHAVQNEYQNQLSACKKQAEKLQNQGKGIQYKLETRQKREQSQREALEAARAALTDNQNHIQLLENMQREYEGFSRAVRLTMKRAQSGAQNGVHGPVSALLTVESPFVVAIDTALGAAASNLVVQTSQDAKTAIAFLKRSDSGRATFLPLDTIRDIELRESNLDACEGCYGTADALVSCQPIYRAVVKSLLARTVIAENLDAALRIAKQYHHRFRIVTLDGQVVQAGGAMTGGSLSKGTGALMRAQTLRTLQDKRKTLQDAAQTAQDALHATQKQIMQLEEEQAQMTAQQVQNQQEQARLTAIQIQHQALLDSLQRQYDSLQAKQEQTRQTGQAWQDTIEQAVRKLAAGQKKISDLQAELDGCAAQRTKQAQALQTLTDQHIALQTEIAENRAKAAAEQRVLDDLRQRQEQMTHSMHESARMQQAFAQKIRQSTAELEQTRKAAADGKARVQTLQAHMTEISAERLNLEGQKTKLEKEVQSRHEEVNQLERENARLDAQIEQFKARETQIVTQLWESYELTPTPAAKLAQKLQNPKAAQQKANDLRTKMRVLGSVNLNAVEEYRKLRARVEFLGTQKEDLEIAQRELYKVIAQMTAQMETVFAAEFAKLNDFFGQTFQEIFGGGHAELKLADTADILHCGIDILVSLPGKAVKTITLLSGGEKAFVAIALYFAILKLRPTPFVVLDEIEAALDDVNVARFAQYVRRLSENTQFIVITHRRGTMEQADMLYGVTMQERGVSRMLVLNLAEATKIDRR